MLAQLIARWRALPERARKGAIQCLHDHCRRGEIPADVSAAVSLLIRIAEELDQ